MNVATDLRRKAVISLAYYHGLRRGEICYLRWQDVDLIDNRLSVVGSDGFRIKTRRSRVVALRQETADLLHRMFLNRANRYVFTSPSAFYWACSKWFSGLVEQARLDHCTLHDLRKTCNTQMLDHGISQAVAMQVSGHSTAAVNQQHYTETLAKQQRAAVDVLPSIG